MVKKNQMPNKPELKKEPENPRLAAIYDRLKELQNFKAEIMDDLNDAMDDFDSQSHANFIEKPAHFDQVVDIAV